MSRTSSNTRGGVSGQSIGHLLMPTLSFFRAPGPSSRADLEAPRRLYRKSREDPEKTSLWDPLFVKNGRDHRLVLDEKS